MKFDEFWTKVTTDLVTQKKFAAQSNLFDAKYSGGRILVSTIHGSLWTIERSEFRQIWNKALELHDKIRFIHSSYSHENVRTSAYVLSIIKHYADGNVMEP